MKKLILFSMMGVLLLLIACDERLQYRVALSRAEAVMNDRPDSALMILDSLGQHEQEFGKHFRMQYHLHRLNAQNKTNVTFTSDSLAKELAGHFDHHGTTNERVLAHYLLGRAYSDMGEAPRAIDCFQNAIETADTTSSGFNYYQLSCVYSQMATLFHNQLLITNEIEARKKASQNAFRAGQTKWGIYNQAISAGAYILLNKKDSAEIILRHALDQYRKYGYTQEALRFSSSLIHLLVEQPDMLDDAKELMDQLDMESDLFDENHELPPSQRQYYYYKGKYYESINRLDSAEFFYRKVYRPNMSPTQCDPMYRGLLSVFRKRHQSDSIAKYAQLYCEANDSSIAAKDRGLTAQMAASYQYNRLQNEARANEAEALRAKVWVGLLLIILVVILFVGLLIWRGIKEKQKKQQTEYDNAISAYKKNLCSLTILENVHQTVIASIQQELGVAQNESRNYRSKYIESQQVLATINAQYEASYAELIGENQVLKARIEELELNKSIVKRLNVSQSLKDSEIIQRISHLVDHQPVVCLTKEELDSLSNTIGEFFPNLIQDMKEKKEMTTLDLRVCLLAALNLRSGDISNLLGISSQQVSNIKHDINKILFNDTSARSLYSNLVRHYGIYL